MCYKCEKFHSEIFKNHNLKKFEVKETEETFIGLCLEENHFDDLQYFCKSHNSLCCAKCITKIKSKENGQHSNCEVCLIENIENEKKTNLEKNIKILEDLSVNIEQIINDIKMKSEKIAEEREELKTKIQKIFTKIRNALNNREDELLLEVDKKYDELFLDEKMVRTFEKLPNRIKINLEKGQNIAKNWGNKNNLNQRINDCLIIENIIKDITSMKDKSQNYKLENNKFEFLLVNDMDNQLIKTISELGMVLINDLDTLKKIKEELIMKNNETKGNINLHHSFFIKCSLHQHPVEILRRFINCWYCDVCRKNFRENIPSYHCTSCDYDICYNCVKDKVTKGCIKDKMKEYY